MDRWATLRRQTLLQLYEAYMQDHRTWWGAVAGEDYTEKDMLRELDYLLEKNLLRNGSGRHGNSMIYQLTAAGRDYVEEHLLERDDKPKVRKV